MLRKCIQFIVASTLSVGVLTLAGPVASPASASFDGGTGTAADPYLVANCTQLQAIRDPSSNLSKHYKLSANIDCSSVNPFTPLSNSTTYFTGSLDGAGFEVSNLTIGCSASTCGLFPTFKSGTAVTIKDITFRTVSVGGAGLSDIGVIAGKLNAPLTLENVELIDPVVTGASDIGGVIGEFTSTSEATSKLTTTDVTVRNPTISSTNSYTGGVIGNANNYPAATMSMIRTRVLGGSITGDTDPSIDTGSSYTGGFFGSLISGSIISGTMSATVSGREIYVGGVAGRAGGTSTSPLRHASFVNLEISGSISAGHAPSGFFEGDSYVGGVVGYAEYANHQSSATLPVVQNVTVSSPSISGTGSRVGGLFGWVSNYRITDTLVTANITGATDAMQIWSSPSRSADVGGFIGSTSGLNTYISRSYYAGNVTAPRNANSGEGFARDYVGGFVGWHRGTGLYIDKSFSAGSVTGDMYVAGLVGRTGGNLISITNSYSRMNVTFDDYERGAGLVTDTCTSSCGGSKVESSYFAGNLTVRAGDRYGIVRDTALTCANNYFDSDVSQTVNGSHWVTGTKYCRDATTGATPLSTADMKVNSNFANWDFTNVWGIDPAENDGYPFLRITPGVDSIAPGAPNTASLVSSSDSGVSSSDRITNINTPEISVATQENGGTVTVTASRNGATDVSCTMTGSTSGDTCTLGTLSDGTWSVTARHTDGSGNQSTLSSATTIVIDTARPTITSKTPAHSTTGISRRPVITVNFNEDIFSNSGQRMRVRDYNAVNDIESIDGGSAAVVVSDNSATITPSVQLDANKLYALSIEYREAIPQLLEPEAGMFSDTAGNFFEGIECCVNWQFTTTTDDIAPTVSWTEPTSPTTSRTLQFGLSLSESVTGLTNDDISTTGTAQGCTNTLSGSGASYTVDVTCTSTGTVIVSVASGAVRDANGNDGPATSVSSAAVTIEDPAPAPLPATSPSPETPTSPATPTTTVPPRNGGSTPTTTVPGGEEDEAPSNQEFSPDTTTPPLDGSDVLSEGTSTTVPTDVPVVDLDLDATVVIKAGTRAIVIRGESIDRAAKSVGVNDGRVRLRPSGGNWQVATLPNPPDMTVVLNDANALDIEFVPTMGETVKVSVPLEITVNDNGVSPWLVVLIAILAGAIGFFAFAILRRRQLHP